MCSYFPSFYLSACLRFCSFSLFFSSINTILTAIFINLFFLFHLFLPFVLVYFYLFFLLLSHFVFHSLLSFSFLTLSLPLSFFFPYYVYLFLISPFHYLPFYLSLSLSFLFRFLFLFLLFSFLIIFFVIPFIIFLLLSLFLFLAFSVSFSLSRANTQSCLSLNAYQVVTGTNPYLTNAFLHFLHFQHIRKDCFQVKSNLLTDFRFTTHMNIMILN
jgi:hypothetical protein